MGCVLLLALLGGIILRCVWVARRACSPQSALIAMGYAGMLIAQVGVNVGMCLYVFPVVGITLPFISYGGSPSSPCSRPWHRLQHQDARFARLAAGPKSTMIKAAARRAGLDSCPRRKPGETFACWNPEKLSDTCIAVSPGGKLWMKKGRNLNMDVTRLSLRPGVRLTAVRTEKIQVQCAGGPPAGPAVGEDRLSGRPGAGGAPPGHGAAPGHGVPLRRPGRAVRRLPGALGPQAGGDPVRGLYRQLPGRRLRPGGGGHPGARRPPCWRRSCCGPIPRTGPSARTTPGRSGTTWWTASGPRSTTSGSTPSCGWWPRCAGRSPSGWTSWGTRPPPPPSGRRICGPGTRISSLRPRWSSTTAARQTPSG